VPKLMMLDLLAQHCSGCPFCYCSTLDVWSCW